MVDHRRRPLRYNPDVTPTRDPAGRRPLLDNPRNICIVRLSALGDTCHVVPLLRVLQRRWPDCRFTWIIGRIEAKLLSLLPEVEFLTVDKTHFGTEFARLRRLLAGRRFDALLHMHVSFRASLLTTLVRAPIKLGFDRPRARDFQWLFTNRRIAARRHQHVLDSFWGFAEALGIVPGLVNHYFPAVDDLAACAFAHAAAAERDGIFASLPAESGPLAQMRGVLTLLLDDSSDAISLLWLVAVASGVLARGGRVQGLGRYLVLVSLALPIIRAGELELQYGALCVRSFF